MSGRARRALSADSSRGAVDGLPRGIRQGDRESGEGANVIRDGRWRQVGRHPR